jgi:hypothetical protein
VLKRPPHWCSLVARVHDHARHETPARLSDRCANLTDGPSDGDATTRRENWGCPFARTDSVESDARVSAVEAERSAAGTTACGRPQVTCRHDASLRCAYASNQGSPYDARSSAARRAVDRNSSSFLAKPSARRPHHGAMMRTRQPRSSRGGWASRHRGDAPMRPGAGGARGAAGRRSAPGTRT